MTADQPQTPAEVAVKIDRATLRVCRVLADLGQVEDDATFHEIDLALSGGSIEMVRDYAEEWLARRARLDTPGYLEAFLSTPPKVLP